MRVPAGGVLARLARAARPGRAWWRVSVSPALAKILIAGGARRRDGIGRLPAGAHFWTAAGDGESLFWHVDIDGVPREVGPNHHTGCRRPEHPCRP